MLWREIDARHLDDGLPRGFLAGTIVEVWVALRLELGLRTSLEPRRRIALRRRFRTPMLAG